MSYQVLARKWRPATFEALVGQEHVLKALRHALDSERLHHAYLFTGTRGVGKTTIARILAKALNCEEGVSATPCGVCSSCVEIAEGRSVDLIEVDAASRTKVEDTRELLDNVQYAPTRSRFKIYLIDEVHMLSGHSFNALLKTLEEPPEHVKFLLATTDPQKLPATVLSRCLQFNLKNLSAERIAQHLGHVLNEEGVAAEAGALWQIGRAAAGSMRDALSLTDQAIAYGSGELVEADVSGMLGSVDRSKVHELLNAVADDDPQAVLAACGAMAELGADFALATDELCSVLHRTAIAQALPTAVDKEFGDAEKTLALAGRLSAEDVQLFFDLAQNARERFFLSSDPRASFEMLALRLLAFRPVAALDPQLRAEDIVEVAQGAGEDALAAKKPEPPSAAEAKGHRTDVSDVGDEGGSGGSPNTDDARAATAERDERRAQTIGHSAGASSAARASQHAELPWHAILDQLSLSGSARNVASHSVVVERGAAQWCLHLDESRANLFNERHQQLLARALTDWHGSALSVRVTTGKVREETPAARAARLDAERLAAAEAAISEDPRVRQLLEDFDGSVVEGSVQVSRDT